MKKEWKALISNRAYLLTWIAFFLLNLVVLILCSLFLCYNEGRTGGYQLNDFVLNALPPRDVSTLLFGITWVCILSGLIILLRTPRRALSIFISIISIGIIRCICMYFVPLEPPEGIIPLRDTVLEGSFYDNKVLLRDLFFSGHTANLALLTFLMDIKWIKIIFGLATLVVGYLLLVQHVHYTIDVLAAFPFAYLAFFISSKSSFYIESRFLQTNNA